MSGRVKNGRTEKSNLYIFVVKISQTTFLQRGLIKQSNLSFRLKREENYEATSIDDENLSNEK